MYFVDIFYLDRQTFKNHERTHDANWSRHKCEVCHRRFRFKEKFDGHISSEHSELYYDRTCIFCQKLFGKPCLLREHIQVKHLQEKPYFCDQCNEEFAWRHALQSHTCTTKKHMIPLARNSTSAEFAAKCTTLKETFQVIRILITTGNHEAGTCIGMFWTGLTRFLSSRLPLKYVNLDREACSSFVAHPFVCKPKIHYIIP